MKAVKRRPGYTEEQIDKEAVLLRAYGNGTEVLIDRESKLSASCLQTLPLVWTDNRLGEATSHSLLAQHKLAPQLLARFQNGLVYRFIRGHVSSSEDLTSEPVWRGVARRLGQWHATLPIISAGKTAVVADAGMEVPLKSSAQASTTSLEQINAITPSKPTPNVWTVMQKWLFALPTTTEAETKRKGVLQKELERTVADLGDKPGLGGNGVRWHSKGNIIQNVSLIRLI